MQLKQSYHFITKCQLLFCYLVHVVTKFLILFPTDRDYSPSNNRVPLTFSTLSCHYLSLSCDFCPASVIVIIARSNH